MNAGGYWKTTSSQITAHWPTRGDNRDFQYWSQVGVWIGKNEKVLAKKPVTEVCRLVAEQFPEINHIEARDFAGRSARL